MADYDGFRWRNEPRRYPAYPAVYGSIGGCILTVGINKNVYTEINYTAVSTGDTPQSCARAKNAAEGMITNLRKAQ